MTVKQVTIRLPKEMISKVARIARMAGVSPTMVYNVFLAAYIIGQDETRERIAASSSEEKK